MTGEVLGRRGLIGPVSSRTSGLRRWRPPADGGASRCAAAGRRARARGSRRGAVLAATRTPRGRGPSPCSSGRRANGQDRVGGGTELVVCHVSHRHGVTGRASRFLRRAGRLPGGGVRGVSGLASLRHRDLAARPGAPLFDRLSWDGRPLGALPRRGEIRAGRSRLPTPREGDDRRPQGCRLDGRPVTNLGSRLPLYAGMSIRPSLCQEITTSPARSAA